MSETYVWNLTIQYISSCMLWIISYKENIHYISIYIQYNDVSSIIIFNYMIEVNDNVYIYAYKKAKNICLDF